MTRKDNSSISLATRDVQAYTMTRFSVFSNVPLIIIILNWIDRLKIQSKMRLYVIMQ